MQVLSPMGGRGRRSVLVKARILAGHRLLIVGVLIVVIVMAIVAWAWIMGDTQPTRWIETPVAAPGAKAAS